MQERLLPISTVLGLVGISRRTLYAEISRGAFPRQLQVSRRRVAWRESEILRWIEDRATA